MAQIPKGGLVSKGAMINQYMGVAPSTFQGGITWCAFGFASLLLLNFSEFMVATKISPGSHQVFCVTKCPNHNLHSQPSPSLAHSYYTILLEQFYNCSASNFQTHLISNKKHDLFKMLDSDIVLYLRNKDILHVWWLNSPYWSLLPTHFLHFAHPVNDSTGAWRLQGGERNCELENVVWF